MTPADRELLRLLAADPTVRRYTRRALAVSAAVAACGLIVATTGGSC